MPLILSSMIYVDDNPEDRKSFRDNVAPGLSNVVDYLSTGEELLARLETNVQMNQPQPGIILVDLMLPGMSGYDLVQSIRRDYKHMDLTPLIIVSGAWDDSSKATAKEVGADWYLGKPVTIFGIFDALRHCTRRYQLGIFQVVEDSVQQVQAHVSSHR